MAAARVAVVPLAWGAGAPGKWGFASGALPASRPAASPADGPAGGLVRRAGQPVGPPGRQVPGQLKALLAKLMTAWTTLAGPVSCLAA